MNNSVITCDNCGTIIGKHYEYPWTDSGQDPPEDDFYNYDKIVFTDEDVYCSKECAEEAGEGE